MCLWHNLQLNTLSRDFWERIDDQCPDLKSAGFLTSRGRVVILCMKRFILNNNILPPPAPPLPLPRGEIEQPQ
jgi:hypothetical protein